MSDLHGGCALKSNKGNKNTVRRVRINFAGTTGRLMAGAFGDWVEIKSRPSLRVNMAQEVRSPADIVVPTSDFGVPPEREFKAALKAIAERLLAGGVVFVGCGYGIGRTGTMVAAVCKLNRKIQFVLGDTDSHDDDPVEDARYVYLPYAVETAAQEEFVRSLSVSWLARRLLLRMNPMLVFDNRFWKI